MLPFISPNIFEVVIYTYKRVTHSEETLQNETRNPPKFKWNEALVTL